MPGDSGERRSHEEGINVEIERMVPPSLGRVDLTTITVTGRGFMDEPQGKHVRLFLTVGGPARISDPFGFIECGLVTVVGPDLSRVVCARHSGHR
jgi:hypothetical protein